MELIIGGAYQGKRVYAEEKYPDIRFLNGEICNIDEVYSAQGIDGFHHIIRRLLKEGKIDPRDFASDLIIKNPDLIIISEEVGYGVVPIDAFDRKYREAVGRACTRLAAFSNTVTRVICGNGVVIKND